MKQRHVAVNIVTGFFAALLCIVLTLLLFVTTLYSSVAAMLSPQNVGALAQAAVDEIVTQLDPENIVQENENLQQTIEEMGMPAEAVGDLLQSEAVSQIINLYAQDISALLTGKEVSGSLTPEAIKDILNNNMDEIVAIATEMAGEEVDAEDIRTQIVTFIDEEADKLIEVLPPVETLAEPLLESGVTDTIEIATNPAILWAAIAVCAVLAGLIYALRCYRFGGFMWVGVCAFIATLLLTVVLSAVRHPILMDLLNQSVSELSGVVGAMLTVYTGRLLMRILLLGGIALLFIAGYILLYFLVIKKKKEAAALAAQAETLPAEIVTEPVLPEAAE